MKVKDSKGRVIDVVRKHRSRCCDKCGAPYRRRALLEAWPIQTPGHHWGWVKVTLRLGVECCAGPHFSKAVLKMGTIQIGWNGPAKLLEDTPIELEKVRVGIKAGIFSMAEKPNRGKLLLEAPTARKGAVSKDKKGNIRGGKNGA